MTDILKFTKEQESAVLKVRAAFNKDAERIASQVELIGNAAPIPLDAWRRIDSKAQQLQRSILAVFNRLATASTTPAGVGDIVNFYPQISDSGAVNISMDGRSGAPADQAVIKYEGTPIPVMDSYATMGWRQMEVMRKGGTGIETTTIANHQRKIAEAMENMVINGSSQINVGGNTIYGLRNFPNRVTGTHGLTLATATGAQWLTAIAGLISALVGRNAYGRVTIFLNYSDWLYISMNEFTSGYPKTILQRLQEIAQVAEFVPAPGIPANELCGIADIATGEWGTILSAMPMVTRPKARHNPEDNYVFGVLAMVAPQFRADYNGQSQLVHITAS